jgi:O-methyltransferase
MDPMRLYLDLMKRCVTNMIYARVEPNFNAEKRANGWDWPTVAHTMIGMKRLDNIQTCFQIALEDGVEGDLIETGVWRGGAVIFMRALLAAHGISNRNVWVADSFEGLPPPDPQKYPADSGDTHHTQKFLAIGIDEVKANFEAYGLLDGQVKFLKGWFEETLPSAPIGKLCVCRLDGDMYGSTMVALESLYPKLSTGGFLIVDDWTIDGAHKAVEDYRSKHGIKDAILSIDRHSAYWRKS